MSVFPEEKASSSFDIKTNPIAERKPTARKRPKRKKKLKTKEKNLEKIFKWESSL